MDTQTYEKEIERLKSVIDNLKDDLQDAIDLREDADEGERDALETQVVKIAGVLKQNLAEINSKFDELDNLGLIESTSKEENEDQTNKSQDQEEQDSLSKSIDENVRLL